MNKAVALITGASRGIGRGIALALAGNKSHHLVINYAGNQAAAEECAAMAKEAGGGEIEADIVQGDVSKTADRQRLVDFTKERFGRLDLLVNNAGVAPTDRADILEASEESFDRLININLKGPYFLSQKAVPLLRETEALSHTPKAIINITSISSYTASVNRGDYCLSKAALSMMTKLYAGRLGEFGIGVFEIQPGITATDMTKGVEEKYNKLLAGGLTPIPRWGQPEDVGKAVVAVAAGYFPFSTGQVFDVDGGFHLRIL